MGTDGIESRINEINRNMRQKIGISAGDAFSNYLDQANTTSGVPNRAPANLRPLIESAAKQNGLDPDLLDSLVHQESGYNPQARSRVGALGLTQLMPETAKNLGVSDPLDPMQNLLGGASYLRQQIDRFGNIPEALAAYNAGPNAVERHGGIPNYTETKNYVKNITTRFEKLKSTSSASGGLQAR